MLRIRACRVSYGGGRCVFRFSRNSGALSVTGKQTTEVGAEVLHAKCARWTRVTTDATNKCSIQYGASSVLCVWRDAFTLLRLPLARDVIHSSAYYAIRDAGSSSRFSLSLYLSHSLARSLARSLSPNYISFFVSNLTVRFVLPSFSNPPSTLSKASLLFLIIR